MSPSSARLAVVDRQTDTRAHTERIRDQVMLSSVSHVFNTTQEARTSSYSCTSVLVFLNRCTVQASGWQASWLAIKGASPVQGAVTHVVFPLVCLARIFFFFFFFFYRCTAVLLFGGEDGWTERERDRDRARERDVATLRHSVLSLAATPSRGAIAFQHASAAATSQSLSHPVAFSYTTPIIQVGEMWTTTSRSKQQQQQTTRNTAEVQSISNHAQHTGGWHSNVSPNNTNSKTTFFYVNQLIK
jgi:hypothetical protein